MGAEVSQSANAHWQPSASLSMLKKRAAFLASLRGFFSQHQVLEVETPVLAPASVTDPHIQSLTLAASPTGHDKASWYLQTSPEFAMKRLLAAGSGDIYQISRVFRQGEIGRLHNAEFTMLEWYRLGYDHHRLMQEVHELLTHLGLDYGAEYLSYAQAYERFAGIDPHQASLKTIIECAHDVGAASGLPVDSLSEKDQWLDLLMGQVVGPRLGQDKATFLFDFPASQAALAKLGEHGLAERFELFLGGIEVANGYHELTDADELLRRFVRDNEQRQRLGLEEVVIDKHLLEAMHHGLPDCAGVAVGLDRLLMYLTGVSKLSQVQAFPMQ